MDETQAKLLEQLEQCFPEWRNEIVDLFEHRPEFRELCRDYSEVAGKLKHWQLHLAHTETVTHDWQVVLLELEAELVETLKTRRKGRASRRI
jgi:hypothetical protein